MLKKTHPNSWFMWMHVNSGMSKNVTFSTGRDFNLYEFTRYNYDTKNKEIYKDKIIILQLEVVNDIIYLEVIKGDEDAEVKEN